MSNFWGAVHNTVFFVVQKQKFKRSRKGVRVQSKVSEYNVKVSLYQSRVE